MTTTSAPWISIEGVDGAGKSSHIPAIVDALKHAGFDVVSTREPGGTELGERLRDEILLTPMALQTEVLLAFASRAEHLDKVIRPALARGAAVVCDRFTDSTRAYQGGGQGYPLDAIDVLAQQVHPNEAPHLTLLFDLPVEESLKRLAGTGKDPDKFEGQGREYFQRVRAAYLQQAEQEPRRFAVIDSSQPLVDVAAQVRDVVERFAQQWNKTPDSSARRRPGP